MNLSQFFNILKARYLLVLFILIVTVFTAVVVTSFLPKVYTAKTSLVIDFKGSDPFGGVVPIQMTSSYMATQIDILRSQRVASRVIDNLKLSENPTARQLYLEKTDGEGSIRNWLADLLLNNLNVIPARDSRIVVIEYSSVDPNFSKTVADAFANAYVEITLELSLDPARQSTAWFNGQLETLREKLETSEDNLTSSQQKLGIVATDERLDTEAARLNALSGQLVSVQAITVDAESRLSQTQRLLRAGSLESETIPEVLKNGFIQSLKAGILKQQAKLADLSEQFGVNHPQYLRAMAETDNLRSKLRNEISTIAQGVENMAQVARANEAALVAAVAEQKAKVLDLKRQRDDLSVLQREVENNRRTYESASQRFNEINLQSQFNQTNISILTKAIAPLKPSRPKPRLNFVLSIFMGGLLAIGFALLIEMADRRVRSEFDLKDGLGLPVLGSLSKGKFRAKTESKKRPVKNVSKVVEPHAVAQHVKPATADRV